MKAPTAHTLREAGKQARERFWVDRRLQDQLDKIKAAYTACAWDIGSAFKGALPASVQALHSAIYPNGMPPEAKAQAVGAGMQQDSDKAEIARLRAERDALAAALQAKITDTEQSEFEEWLSIVCPSGDMTQVEQKWKRSAAYAEFTSKWGWAIAALASIKQEGKA